MEGGLISDGVIAQDIKQASSFWRIREVKYFMNGSELCKFLINAFKTPIVAVLLYNYIQIFK